MTVIRTFHNQDNPYTLLNNQALFDPTLSNAARGLWAQCMARKSNWIFYMSEMRNHTKDGKDALSTQMNELIQAGYVARLQVKEKVGHKLQFKSVDYVFFETKITAEMKTNFLQNFKKELPYAEFLEPKPKQPKKSGFKKGLSQPGNPEPESPAPENPQLVNTDRVNTNRENIDKKESIYPVENVHNSSPAENSILFEKESSIETESAEISDAEIKRLLDERIAEWEKESQEREKREMQERDILFKISVDHFRDFIVKRWLKKYGHNTVIETVRFYLQTLKTQKTPIRDPEPWMESALKRNFAKTYKTSLENKAFAEKLKKEYRLGHLKINKRYCQDTETSKDYYYELPKEVFESLLKRLTETRWKK